MAIYRFRVLIDDPSEAFRDIEIRSNQTFLDLHKAIKKAFDFKGDEMACFWVSDDEWTRGIEIPLADMGFAEEGKVPLFMKEVQIGDHIRDTRQRFVYAYDFLHMWMFMVELIHAEEPVKGKRYPQVVMAMGKPPAENSRELVLPEAVAADDGDSYAADTEERYEEDEIDGFSEEEEGEYGHGGHGADDGLSGHEQLPDDLH